MRLIYKIVRVINGKNYSSARQFLHGHAVQYFPGIEAFPSIQGSKLFAYESLKHAIAAFDLLHESRHIFELWAATTTGNIHALLPHMLPQPSSGDMPWDGGQPVNSSLCHTIVRPGTILIDDLILLKRACHQIPRTRNYLDPKRGIRY